MSWFELMLRVGMYAGCLYEGIKSNRHSISQSISPSLGPDDPRRSTWSTPSVSNFNIGSCDEEDFLLHNQSVDPRYSDPAIRRATVTSFKSNTPHVVKPIGFDDLEL